MLTVVIHVVGLGLMSQSAVHVVGGLMWRTHGRTTFVVLTGAATLLATCLHGIEAAIWAAAYWLLGALPDFRSSVLYSLNAIQATVTQICPWKTTGNSWGALEALNGWLLFGLTLTAFLFAVIHKAWLSDNRAPSNPVFVKRSVGSLA